jgi:hypothetical protein
MKHGSFLCVLACALVTSVPPAFAQLPITQLTSIFPPGGKQGTAVEVTVAGNDMDDVGQLIFSHNGLTAAAKMTAASALAPAQPVPGQFTVTIASDVPPGTYEVRAMGRFGLSNPRSFSVGTLGEITDGSGNSAADKPLEVAAGTTVSGRLDANAYDYFRLSLKSGERVLIDVAAERIDSRLDATLVLVNPQGREVARVTDGVGADPVLDFTAPAAGAYGLKLHDAVYGGGNDYFYRLTVSAAPFIDFIFPPSGPAGSNNQYTLFGRNLPGGQPAEGLTFGGVPLEKLQVTIPLPTDEAAQTRLDLASYSPLRRAWQDGIEFRLPTPGGVTNPVSLYFSKSPSVVLEAEPNGDAKSAQKITVPCEYVGQFYPQRDSDWVQFDAKKGQTYWIEVLSSQLGFESDAAFALYRVTKNDKGEEQSSEITQVDDSPERTRQIGGEFDATSDDPAYKFVVPEDGVYRLLVRDQFGDSRQDPSYVYRLSIRTPQPDFRVLAYPVVPTAAQQQQQQNQIALASASVRKGGTSLVALAVQRRDEFSGEIAVSVEGLPPGVKCPGAIIGGDVADGSLVLIAADDASAWAGPIKVIAKGKIGDREVVREARYGVIVWGTPNRQQQRAEFRLSPVLELGVIDKEMDAALVRTGEDKIYETSLGGNVEFPLAITRRGDFKDAVKLVAAGLPQQLKPKDVTLDGGKADGKFELQLNQQNMKPGAYTFYLRGEAKRKYARNPEAVATCESEQKRIGEMIKSINEEIKKATEAKDDAAVKAAQEKLKEANQLKTQADKRLDDAKKASQPKDVQFALVSTPIKLRVKSAPFNLTAKAADAPLKAGQKQELAIQVERLFGFKDSVELSFNPPEGVPGLSAQNVTLNKDQEGGKLEIVSTDKTPPGQHVCTLRARGKFNNVQVETTLSVTVVVAQ